MLRGVRRYTVVLAICLLQNAVAFSYESADKYEKQDRTYLIQEEFADYMTNVRDKISKTWNPPDVLEEGHAVVIFKLDRGGNIVSSYIKESSGNNLYDDSAIYSIEQASPYMPFPQNTSKDFITIKYSFDSSIVKADDIKDLIAKSEYYVNRDNQKALNYIDQAIKMIEGDPSGYFLYARRVKIDKLMGNNQAVEHDRAECKRLKAKYDANRICKCKEALLVEETPFGYFTLANAYDLAGDYKNAIYSIDKAISMTELNHAYKRYRAEIVMRSSK